MARFSIADRAKLTAKLSAKLTWLLLRAGLRRTSGRVNGYRPLTWPVSPHKNDRLLIAPQDLRTADATRASEIYSGRFAFAGKVVICGGRSIFEMTPPSDDWVSELLGFGWLRHLRAAESGIARANARALVDEWIGLQGAWHPVGWHTDVLARRIISWLSQAPLLLQDTDARFYRRFLRSLLRQVRHLRHTAADAHRGATRLQAAIALCYAALCIASQARHTRSATAWLTSEIERQILPDGGHISRDPGVIIDVLIELLPLRQAYASRNIAPPPALLNAIDRMMPMLRFFRHSEGTFAHFNGMGTTPVELMLTLLAYDDSRGAPLSNAAYSAYQRLEAGGGVLVMDTGRSPPLETSVDAHAGCLSFEFSSPKQSLIVVNCGMPATARGEWRSLTRATAAHSTVTFNDESSAHFAKAHAFKRLLGGLPMVGGPTRVSVSREEQIDSITVRAIHDGYAARFGVLHERTVTLAADGTRFEGEDLFLAADGSPEIRTAQDRYAVRFHLHPSIKASRLTDGQGVLLMMPNREVWTFSASEKGVALEDSVYLAGNEGPRRTAQIVIHGQARSVPRVAWRFQQSTPAAAPAGASAARRVREKAPKLPL